MPRRGRKPSPNRPARKAFLRAQRRAQGSGLAAPSGKGKDDASKVRLHHALAELGVASRRGAEQLILQGRVTVNGEVIDRLPAFVNPATDRVVVEGRHIQLSLLTRRDPQNAPRDEKGKRLPTPDALRKQYIMVYKPERTLTSTADKEGELVGSERTTVADLVKLPTEHRVYPVGRLEFHASGIVLMTNDGELANRLTHPRFGVGKTYRVWLRGTIDEQAITKLDTHLNKLCVRLTRTAGINLSPSTVIAQVKLAARRTAGEVGEVDQRTGQRQGGDKTVVDITLTGGKALKLPAMLTYLGFKVARIMQVAIGPLELNHLAAGQWRPLFPQEIRALKAAARGDRALDDHETGEAAPTSNRDRGGASRASASAARYDEIEREAIEAASAGRAAQPAPRKNVAAAADHDGTGVSEQPSSQPVANKKPRVIPGPAPSVERLPAIPETPLIKRFGAARKPTTTPPAPLTPAETPSDSDEAVDMDRDVDDEESSS